MVSQKSLDERLKAIREAVGETVIIKVGLMPNGDPDILEVKSLFQQEAPEEASTEVPSYIG